MSNPADSHTLLTTVDVDWAPDWAVRELMEFLVGHGIHSTWFITHESPVLDELRARPDLIDLGIHPNFLAGSSHGQTPVEVLEYCMKMVPEARCMRAHALVQSTPILQVVADTTPIEVEASLYLRDGRHVRPHQLPLDRGGALRRLPYVWEDDLEFFAERPAWDAAEFIADRAGAGEITMFDTHPIHFALNSASIGPYSELKAAHGDVRRVTAADAGRVRHPGEGARTFVEGLPALAKSVDLSSSLFSVARR